MGKKDVLEILHRFHAALESGSVHVDRMVLFGSWSRGEGRPSSDIDVLVVSSDFVGKDHWARCRLLGSAVYKVFAPIQAVALTPDEWVSRNSTICQFAEDGELIMN